jgi:uncharacterized coiled-coil protein SlyX
MKIFRLFVAFALICFALSPAAHAVVPPPDGGYPNFITAEGTNALQNLTTGAANTGVGWYALFSAGAGSNNTGVGAGALALNTADNNTAVGLAAMFLNTTGHDNVANGTGALVYNDSGADNAAVGAFALYKNIDGSFNTAVGSGALFDNVTGADNTAIGDAALSFNDVTGTGLANGNTAVGSVALTFNTDGDRNTAVGALALFDNTTGPANTATGYQALHNNTEGSANTAIGVNALFGNTTGDSNTAVGVVALSNNTGSGSTALGYSAGNNVFTANNVTCIGANVSGADVSNTTWIANVYGVTTQSGTTAPVIVSNTGQLGTLASSERFKKDIATMEKASEIILSLRPVTFHYKTDTQGTPQFGLIAEEVAKVNPALVLPDKEGKPYTVRYEAVNAMLLNEFLKEHKTVQEQGATITTLKATAAEQEATITQLKQGFQSKFAQQQKQIEALTAGLQKVSAQLAAASPSRGGLEASKPAPQMVKNP